MEQIKAKKYEAAIIIVFLAAMLLLHSFIPTIPDTAESETMLMATSGHLHYSNAQR